MYIRFTVLHLDPSRPLRRGCGLRGLEPTGSLRTRAILIRRASVRALIVLALTLCPVYHWTSWWRAPSLGDGMDGEGKEWGSCWWGGGSRLNALYRAPIKGSLSEQLPGPKKGMFIPRWVMGWAGGKEWRARGESCLLVRPGRSFSNWLMKPENIRAGNKRDSRASKL